jgi:dCTP diphosphatase
MTRDSLEGLKRALREFARERDWDQFHSPKNLACALSVEVAELLEHFQWSPDNQALPADQLEAVSHEIADVLLYLTRLADKLGIDPVAAAKAKLVLNGQKYPVDLSRGSSKKYTDL